MMTIKDTSEKIDLKPTPQVEMHRVYYMAKTKKYLFVWVEFYKKVFFSIGFHCVLTRGRECDVGQSVTLRAAIIVFKIFAIINSKPADNCVYKILLRFFFNVWKVMAIDIFVTVNNKIVTVFF